MTTIFPQSNFQSALIFIQIIAVPFFIVLLLIHILFAGVWSDSEPCSTLCDEPPTNTYYFKPLIELPTTETTTTIKPIPTFSKASIAALVEVRPDNDILLKCAVAIISKNSALSTENCLHLTGHTIVLKQNLYLRLLSENWKEGGVLTPIDNVRYLKTPSTLLNRLAVINFTASPVIEDKLIPINMHKDPNLKYLSAKYAYFNKSNLLDFVKISILPVRCCHIGEQHNNSETCTMKRRFPCDLIGFSPLIYGNFLVAMHALTSDCSNGLFTALKTGSANFSNFHSDIPSKK